MAEAKLSDCLTLGHKLRKEDAAEIKAFANLKGPEALILGFYHSHICISIFTEKDEICAMFGTRRER